MIVSLGVCVGVGGARDCTLVGCQCCKQGHRLHPTPQTEGVLDPTYDTCHHSTASGGAKVLPACVDKVQGLQANACLQCFYLMLHLLLTACTLLSIVSLWPLCRDGLCQSVTDNIKDTCLALADCLSEDTWEPTSALHSSVTLSVSSCRMNNF